MSGMEGRSNLKIGRKEACDTDERRSHLEVERSKVKVTRPLNAVTEYQPYLRHGKAYELTRITDMRGDLKGQRSKVKVCLSVCLSVTSSV